MIDNLLELKNILFEKYYKNNYYESFNVLPKSKSRIVIIPKILSIIYNSYYPISNHQDLEKITDSKYYKVPYSSLSALEDSNFIFVENESTGHFVKENDFTDKGVYFGEYYISTTFPIYYKNHLLVTSLNHYGNFSHFELYKLFNSAFSLLNKINNDYSNTYYLLNNGNKGSEQYHLHFHLTDSPSIYKDILSDKSSWDIEKYDKVAFAFVTYGIFKTHVVYSADLEILFLQCKSFYDVLIDKYTDKYMITVKITSALFIDKTDSGYIYYVFLTIFDEDDIPDLDINGEKIKLILNPQILTFTIDSEKELEMFGFNINFNMPNLIDYIDQFDNYIYDNYKGIYHHEYYTEVYYSKYNSQIDLHFDLEPSSLEKLIESYDFENFLTQSAQKYFSIIMVSVVQKFRDEGIILFDKHILFNKLFELTYIINEIIQFGFYQDLFIIEFYSNILALVIIFYPDPYFLNSIETLRIEKEIYVTKTNLTSYDSLLNNYDNLLLIKKYITDIFGYKHKKFIDININKLIKYEKIDSINDVFYGDFRFNDEIEFVLKTSFQDLDNEYIIGLEINKLRKLIPNFILTYAFFKCGQSNTKNPLLCDGGKNLKNILVLEKVNESLTLERWLKNRNYSIIEFLNVILQVFSSLKIAKNEMGFTHYDLHTQNVLLSKLQRMTNFKYYFGDIKDIYINNIRYAAVILDYEFSYIKNINLKKHSSSVYNPPSMTNNFVDIYTLIISCLTDIAYSRFKYFQKEKPLILLFFNQFIEKIKNLYKSHTKAQEIVLNILSKDFTLDELNDEFDKLKDLIKDKYSFNQLHFLNTNVNYDDENFPNLENFITWLNTLIINIDLFHDYQDEYYDDYYYWGTDNPGLIQLDQAQVEFANYTTSLKYSLIDTYYLGDSNNNDKICPNTDMNLNLEECIDFHRYNF